MKRVIVYAGGPLEEVVDLKQLLLLQDETVFIGADRGAIHLLAKGITPDEIIGDFDSLTDEELHMLKLKIRNVTILQAEKDETDTHIALQEALKYKPDEVILTGVSGGRLDHYEAALHDVCHFQLNHPTIPFSIQDKQNRIQFLFPGTHEVEKYAYFKYISFFSFGEMVKNITLKGFKYNVANENMMVGDAKFISNEQKDRTSTISFTAGICLMIRSSD
ncbi:thiamine diphosphokinase [Psychrobacillus sp. FSL H8-0484]|uniref:thiamine diphosphokinase n=1 Tax=Psychrobacillus sp. FSL H8-0484 TaxID=2921390 RepID=UPI0030F9C89C